MQLGVLFVGLVMAVATLLTIDWKLPGGLIEGTSGIDEACTAGFTVLVLAQLFNCLNSRPERASAFNGIFTNRWLWGAIALSLALQVLVVHAPFLNDAFGTAPLPMTDWVGRVAAASCVLWLDEIKKLVVRSRLVRRADRESQAAARVPDLEPGVQLATGRPVSSTVATARSSRGVALALGCLSRQQRLPLLALHAAPDRMV